MADENHIIRIILEGRDKLSGAFKGTSKSVNDDINKIQLKAKDLNKDLKVLGDSLEFKGRTVGKGQGAFAAFAKDIDQMGIKVKDLKKELRDIIPQDSQKNASGFFSALGQGLQEAKRAQEALQASLGTDKDSVQERKRLLDSEVRSEQIKLNQQKFREKEELLASQKLREAERRGGLENARIIGQASIDQLRKKQKEEDEGRKKAFRKAESDIKLESRVEQAPLVALRKEAARLKQVDAVIEITREINKIRLAQKEAEAANRLARDDDIEARKKSVDNEVKTLRDAQTERTRVNRQELKSLVRDENQDLKEQQARVQAEFSAGNLEKRSNIKAPDQEEARARESDLRRLNNLAHENDTIFQKAGRSVGLWGGDLRRGFTEGKRGLVDFNSEARKGESALARIGQRAGAVAGNLGNMVNLRWFFLTSAIQLLGTAVTQLGAAFISVASSASLAAAAIGTGFAAAVSQALPVVGILAAAFARVQNVFKAVQLFNTNKTATAADAVQNSQKQREEAERLTDAQHGLQQALVGVSDAQYNLIQAGKDVTDALTRNKEAVLNLANTRVQVSRDIVDANFREQQAAISLRAAELGVIDAKRQLLAEEKAQKNNQADIEAAKGAIREANQRLQAAKSAGDQAGIADARAQLAVAEQSLSAIEVQAQSTNLAVKEAKNNVRQAKLDSKEAVVENKRAKEDNKKAQSEGVEGNQQVIAARRELKASIRGISDARRQQALGVRAVAEALYAVKIAQREVNDLQADKKSGLNDQIAGQRQLKAILDELSPSERKLYQSLLKLQDVYKKAFRPITDIIIDAISRAVDVAAKLLQDPKIIKAATKIAKALAAGIDSLTKFASSKKVRDDLVFFMDQAAQNLPTIVSLLQSVLDIFINLARIGAPIFKDIIGSPAKSIRATRVVDDVPKGQVATQAKGATGLLGIVTNIDKLTNNKKETDSFFGIARENLDAWTKLGEAVAKIVLALGKGSNKAGLKLVTDLTNFLNGLAEWMKQHPKEVEAFFDRMAENIEKLASALEKIIPVLFEAFTSDEANNFAIFIIEVVIPGLVIFIQTIQTATGLLLKLFDAPVVGHFFKIAIEIAIAEKALNRVFPITQKVTDAFKLLAKFVGEKLFILLKTLGTKILPALGVGIRLVGVALRFVFITNPWIAAVIGIIALIVLLDRKFHFIKPTIMALQKAFLFVFEWIKDHWKLLTVLLLGPIGLVVIGIVKYRDKILGIFKSIIDWVRSHWKILATIMASIFLFPLGLIAVAVLRWHDRMIDIGKKVVNGIAGFFKKLPGLIGDAIKAAPQKILDVFKGLGPKIAKQIAKGLPAPIRKAIGLADDAADIAGKGKDLVGSALGKIGFKQGGVVHATQGFPGSPLGSDTIPAWLTPGEWVLNKKQQATIARIAQTTTGALSSILFGTGGGKAISNIINAGEGLDDAYNAFQGPNFKLIPHQDTDGKTVWFAAFRDGTFGQVSTRDADKMLKSRGFYIPGYAKNFGSRHGGLLPGNMKIMKSALKNAMGNAAFKTPYGLGGSGVSAGRYAQGGPVLNSPAGSRGGNTLHQQFNVRTEGETDWNYVMRIGAIHAQESF